jgi:hypothetical protein
MSDTPLVIKLKEMKAYRVNNPDITVEALLSPETLDELIAELTNPEPLRKAYHAGRNTTDTLEQAADIQASFNDPVLDGKTLKEIALGVDHEASAYRDIDAIQWDFLARKLQRFTGLTRSQKNLHNIVKTVVRLIYSADFPKSRWSCSDDASGTSLTLGRQERWIAQYVKENLYLKLLGIKDEDLPNEIKLRDAIVRMIRSVEYVVHRDDWIDALRDAKALVEGKD